VLLGGEQEFLRHGRFQQCAYVAKSRNVVAGQIRCDVVHGRLRPVLFGAVSLQIR
jgi:hypothetical protein